MFQPRIEVRCALAAAMVIAAPLTRHGTVAGQDHDHPPEEHDIHHSGLHFPHPIITDSVSPDTKVRLDHQLTGLEDGDHVNVGAIEAEYAFIPAFSIEVALPYSYTDGVAGNFEAALKFANFALADMGILLGYGLEVGFPTAGEVEEEEEAGGHLLSVGAWPTRDFVARSSSSGGFEAEWELSPFLNIGFKSGRLEVVAWGRLGVPFDLPEDEEPEVELGYELAALYHASSRLDALVELDGTGGLSGEAVGEDVLNLSPGLRFQVLADQPLVLGTSVGFPLTSEETFDTRWVVSAFWHF